MRGHSRHWLQSFAALRISANPGAGSASHGAPFIKAQPSVRRLSASVSHASNAPEPQEPVRAAPEIDFDHFESSKTRIYTKGQMGKLRIVPRSPSYFTARPQYTDDLLMLRAVLREYQTLPVCKIGEAPRVSWRSLASYKSLISNEPLRASRFTRMLELVRRLNYIHPDVRPLAVTKAIERFARSTSTHTEQRKPILIDEWGRARGLGRRKSSTAQVWLVEGEGEFMINGKSLAEAFARVHDRESVLWALKATDRIDKYNVWALVHGGGTTGQAEALTLGLANALMAHEPLLKPHLRKAGVVSRDRRQVERKKHGRVKARKRPTWVKR